MEDCVEKREWADEHHMGKAAASNKRGPAGKKTRLGGEGYSRGCRKIGESKPGPKSFYKPYFTQVNEWVEEEEKKCHDLDATDLIEKLQELLAERYLALLLKQRTAKDQKLDDEEEIELLGLQIRLLKLATKPNKWKNYLLRLLHFKLEFRNLVPTRKTTLDDAQQAIRAELTWQDFDEKVSAIGLDKELR